MGYRFPVIFAAEEPEERIRAGSMMGRKSAASCFRTRAGGKGKAIRAIGPAAQVSIHGTECYARSCSLISHLS